MCFTFGIFAKLIGEARGWSVAEIHRLSHGDSSCATQGITKGSGRRWERCLNSAMSPTASLWKLCVSIFVIQSGRTWIKAVKSEAAQQPDRAEKGARSRHLIQCSKAADYNQLYRYIVFRQYSPSGCMSIYITEAITCPSICQI